MGAKEKRGVKQKMLSTLEKKYMKQKLDKYGISGFRRFAYFNFAREIKGRKVQTRDDIEKVIGKWKQEGLNEELMKSIIKILELRKA